jgi:GTPase
MSPRVLVAEESVYRLPPENDLGNIEYKVHLVEPTQNRLQHLATQLKWRLNEGQGEAIYELGVLDDGRMQGLEPSDLQRTMETMHKMCHSVGASLYIVSCFVFA